MQETEYGPDPENVLVFDFDNATLQDLQDVCNIHDHINSNRFREEAKTHLAESCYNARRQDTLLGIQEDLANEVHDVIWEVGNMTIEGHSFGNRQIQRLADEFERQMERAETAAEVGVDRVETEEY